MTLSHEMIKDDNLTQFYFSEVDSVSTPIPAHWHNHLEIIYINRGSMTAYINERSYILNAGDILIVNPRDIHTTHTHEDTHYSLLQIPTIHLERISPDWKLLHFAEYIPASADKDSLNSGLVNIFRKLSRLNSTREKGYHLLLLVKLYEFLHLLYTRDSSVLSASIRSRTDRDVLRIEQIMQYAKRNCNRQITLAEAAEHIMVTPEYFCRLFKKYTGQTFFTYLAQIRLLNFYHDLIQTEESITYLLDKNGITNYKQFMSMFKKAYGTTPHRLRKNLK